MTKGSAPTPNGFSKVTGVDLAARRLLAGMTSNTPAPVCRSLAQRSSISRVARNVEIFEPHVVPFAGFELLRAAGPQWLRDWSSCRSPARWRSKVARRSSLIVEKVYSVAEVWPQQAGPRDAESVGRHAGTGAARPQSKSTPGSTREKSPPAVSMYLPRSPVGLA